MIISASRRTDIPAFYSEWFFNRLEAGYLLVINPMNRKQISKIMLNSGTVDCIVFWTKNPKPMLSKLKRLAEKGFQYYFQFTLTAYDTDIEAGVKNKNELIKTFRELSKRIGKERVIWRYDPILLNKRYTKEFHYEWFGKLCGCLAGYTNTCVISFLDLYTKTKRNVRKLEIQDMSEDDMKEIAKNLALIASGYNLTLQTCSEEIDLSDFGIKKGKCVDDDLIEKILGKKIKAKKDDTQREVCGCVKSIDIGQYNTCKHFCSYCYANYSSPQVEENLKDYHVNSEVLMGKLRGDEKITVREMKSIIDNAENEWEQLRLINK